MTNKIKSYVMYCKIKNVCNGNYFFKKSLNDRLTSFSIPASSLFKLYYHVLLNVCL